MSSTGKLFGATALILLLMSALSACSTLEGMKDTADTVDQAVNLLHEIDENGTWQQIADGLENLSAQKQGFAAAVHLHEGKVDRAGNIEDPPDQNVTMIIQVDAENNALLHIVEVGQGRDYLVEGFRATPGSSRIYRVENGQYFCAEAADEGYWLQNGLNGVFERYGITAASVQFLTVTNKTGDETIANRPATRYRLESKIPEALAILKKLDNTELQRRVDAAGKSQITGELYLDKDTQALLRFVSTSDDPDAGQRIEFSFEITQWGGINDIPRPVDSQIAVACP